MSLYVYVSLIIICRANSNKLRGSSTNIVWKHVYMGESYGLLKFSFLSILFYSPLAYVDPLHCDMTHLFVELLKDSLAEYSYDADIAELNYKLETTVYGIYVS